MKKLIIGLVALFLILLAANTLLIKQFNSVEPGGSRAPASTTFPKEEFPADDDGVEPLPAPTAPEPDPVPTAPPPPPPSAPTNSIDLSAPSLPRKPPSPPVSPSSFELYEVQLETPETLYIPGLAGKMKLWIGEKGKAPSPAEKSRANTASIQASGQKSAIIEPWSRGFDFTPPVSGCFLLDPVGIVKRFDMAPKEVGTFDVGADVNLYLSDDCTGTPVPRDATKVSVSVEIDQAKKRKAKWQEMRDIAWEKFLEYWGLAVAAVFALLLAIFKKQLVKIAKKLGIKPPEDEG